MHIEYFHDFIVLAEELNYHSAAKNLHMSQATLSKHINALEDHYGVRLFDRDKTYVHLTNRGSVLLESALDIWTDYGNSQMLMKQSLDEAQYLFLGGQLDNPLEFNIVSQAIEHFRRAVPGCMPQLTPCTTTSPKVLMGALKRHEVDFTVFYMDEEMLSKTESGFKVAPIVRFPIDAVLKKDNALGKKKTLSLHDLNGQSLIRLVGPRFNSAWKLIEKQLRAAGLAIQTVPTPATGGYDYTSIDPEGGILLITAAGKGCPELQHPGCVRVPVNPSELHLDLYAVYRAEDTSQIVTALADSLRKSYAEAFSGKLNG